MIFPTCLKIINFNPSKTSKGIASAISFFCTLDSTCYICKKSIAKKTTMRNLIGIFWTEYTNHTEIPNVLYVDQIILLSILVDMSYREVPVEQGRVKQLP